MPQRLSIAAGLLALALTAGWMTPDARAERVAYLRHPALSPDGRTLAFNWSGDIWTVPVEGGHARRLTVHPADDEQPVWSRDGRQIAFASNRSGSMCIYIMTSAGSGLTRLTFSDQGEAPSDFSPDDQFVYYHTRKSGDVDWEPRIFRVPAAGGEAVRTSDAGGSAPRISPDGRHMAFNRGNSTWWRTGYRGSAAFQVWVRDLESGDFRQLTDFDGADMWPVWDGDGRGVYFLSDRAGLHNVWYQPLAGGDARQVTFATGDRVREFAVAADGATLVYTQWDRTYAMTLPGGAPRELLIEAASDTVDPPVQLETFTRDADELAISPDGKEFAVVVRGELFVGQTEPERLTRRVTESIARDRSVTWSPDGKALFFMSDAAGQEDIYRATSAEDPPKALCDSLRFKIERVTDHAEMEQSPQVSPDGKKLSYVRGLGTLIVRDLKSGEETTLLETWNWPQVSWSPDSKWIAYAVADAEYNNDIWIVPADGGAPAMNITRHPDNDRSPQWSADGQILAFTSSREGFDSDLYFVFLSPALHEKSAVDLSIYFKQAGDAAGKRKPLKKAVASGPIALAGAAAGTQPSTAPVDKPEAEEDKPKEDDLTLESRLRALIRELLKEPEKEKKEDEPEAEKFEYELDTAWQRIRRVTSLPENQSTFALSPDGALYAFVSRHEPQTGLYTVKWDGSEVKRIRGGGAGDLQWDLPGKRLYYLSGGVPNSLTASGGDHKTHAFRARMLIDRAELAHQKFSDAARMLGMRFYHPTLKDLDWPALSEKYRALALQTKTWTEFNEIFNLLQGELNGSHLGISGPSVGGTRESIGYLGCTFDPDHPGPGLKVRSVTGNTPADRSESRIYPGDVLLEVNGRPVGPDASIEQALIGTVNELVIVRYLPSPDRPAAAATEPAVTAGDKDENDAETAPAAAETDAAPNAPVDAAAAQELVIRPTSAGDFRRRQYEAWVDANARYVEEKSGGRVAYTHISGMGEPQFYQFERDLYAVAHGKDGLIIDVRNNGGGWTADWVMAVLNVRRHAYTVGRGGVPGYPQDRLIFYSWPKPATMMCNQHSYSNAEIVSHAFKNLGRGPLVGMTTFGAVISTGSYGLIDGSRIRMPFRGWYTVPGGEDMDVVGAEPDIKVPLTPNDEVAGRDPQLDAAIQATLDQLPGE